MSPGQLLEHLESLGSINPEILRKIRRQVENPSKTVKPSAVLRYLVTKNQLTKSQAAAILKGESKTKTAQLSSHPDEFEVVEPEQKEYDTDDLTGLLRQPNPKPEPQSPSKSPPKPTPKPVPVASPKREQPRQTAPRVSDEQTVLDVDQLVEPGGDMGRGAPIEIGSEALIEQRGAFADFATDDANDPFDDENVGSARRSSFSFAGKKDLRDQWSTKWLYIGFGILGFLVIMGGLLYIATMGVKAEDQFAAAMDSYDKLAYLDAAKKFEEFYTANPNHERVPTAKALRAQCLIANPFSSRYWEQTITTADQVLPPLVEDEDSKIEDIRDDLGHMLPESLKEITDQAKKATELPAMEAELAKVEKLKKIIDNNVYIPTSQRNKPLTASNLAKIENNIKALQDGIDKEKDYQIAIVTINELGDASETDKAFALYQQLIRNYGDLAAREELRNTMLGISAKERELVTPIQEVLTVVNTPRPSPIRDSVVLASQNGVAVENLKNEIINYLADGSVYGIQAGDGTILWRRFVGYQSRVQPELLDQDSVLVSDQQEYDLLLLEKSTGNIRWRTEIGEPFLAPTFNDAMIVVTTESGKVIQFDRETGTVQNSVKLPQAANVAALIADRDPYIYQTGKYSNLYVLSNQDLSCREVYYLGHYRGSIAVPPQAWSGFILVAINGGNSCDLMVLKPAKNGLELELVQVLNQITNGPVTTPMQRFGRWMLLTADNGEIRILELQPNDENNPVTKFASDKFENSSNEPAFVLTEGSNLWIASRGISRFRIQRTQGTFQRDETIDHGDTFLTPLKKLDDNIFHISRRQDSGMLSASLVDAKSLTPIWRTDFGGQVVGAPQVAPDSVVAVSNQGDLFKITADNWEKHYATATARASTVVEDLKFSSLVNLPENSFAVLGPISQSDFLFGNSATASSNLLQLAPPANHPACPPMAMGDHLIVPSSEGQVTRIDPQNGQMVGTPFQPPISPGTETNWFEPTLIGNQMFAIAAGNDTQDASQNKLYLLDAKETNSIEELGLLTSEHPFKSRLINNGQSVFGVLEGEKNDFLAVVAIEPKLEMTKTIGLPGRVVAGPWKSGQDILLKMDNDQLLMLGDDLSTRWTLSVGNDQFAGAPQNFDSNLLLSFRSGKLLLVDSVSGKIGQQYDLRQPIASAPTVAGSTLLFSGMDGTVHVVELPKHEEAN